jgi:hypothetical protein
MQSTHENIVRLRNVFLLSLLMALPLAAAAQTNSPGQAQTSQPTNSPPNPAPADPAEIANIMYNFSMPLEFVLNEIYGPLVERTYLREPSGTMVGLKDVLITLHTKTPLTKSEAIQALEELTRMNGFFVVPVGEKSFKVISTPPQSPPAMILTSADLLGRGKTEDFQFGVCRAVGTPAFEPGTICGAQSGGKPPHSKFADV